MQRYVCVRVTRMDDVNIALFDYDRYNTLYFFLLNADEQIYMRYGGRDSASPDTYLNLESIELALKQGLDLHGKWRKGEWKPAAPNPKPRYPREIPLLVERTFARNQCVECHLIGDFDLQHREEEGVLDKPSQMFRSPDIKTLGIFLDVPKGLVVAEAKGPAAQAGLRTGDTVTSLNDKPVWTFADLQWELDKVARSSPTVRLGALREGKPVAMTINLPIRWWWTDIRYKQLTIDPRVYFESTPLDAAEKQALSLSADSFASRVKFVSGLAKSLKAHELKVDDVIVSVDGVTSDPLADSAEAFIRLRRKAGDRVTMEVLRNGERVSMPLQTFRMSFRK
jgi:hypothetical protein